MRRYALVFAAVLASVLGGCMDEEELKAAREERRASNLKGVDTSESAQAERQEIIQKLVDSGIFHKIEGGSAPSIHVTPAFYLLDFDTKKSATNAVFTYYYIANNTEYLTLYDHRTGNSVGSYSIHRGLRMDD